MVKNKMTIFRSIFCLFSMIVSSVICEDCPTTVELNLRNNYPKTRQLNSSTLEVDWSHLWNEMEWKGCVHSAKVILNDVYVETVTDVDVKKTTISVEPCIDLKVVIELSLKNTETILEYDVEGGTDATIRSFPSKDSKTFRPPKAKSDVSEKVVVNYLKNDLTSVDVQVKFVDLVEDPSCNKVVDVVILLKDKNDLSTHPHLFVKSVGIFRLLEEIISGVLVSNNL